MLAAALSLLHRFHIPNDAVVRRQHAATAFTAFGTISCSRPRWLARRRRVIEYRVMCILLECCNLRPAKVRVARSVTSGRAALPVRGRSASCRRRTLDLHIAAHAAPIAADFRSSASGSSPPFHLLLLTRAGEFLPKTHRAAAAINPRQRLLCRTTGRPRSRSAYSPMAYDDRRAFSNAGA